MLRVTSVDTARFDTTDNAWGATEAAVILYIINIYCIIYATVLIKGILIYKLPNLLKARLAAFNPSAVIAIMNGIFVYKE